MPKPNSPVQRKDATAPKAPLNASLSDFYKIFDDARDLSIVENEAPSKELLAALDKMAENRIARRGARLFALCTGMAVLTYALSATLFDFNAIQAQGFYALSTAMVGFFWACLRSFDNDKLRALQRLSDKEDCDKALRLAKSVPACEAYRQSVLNQGREFRVLDLTVMQLTESKVLEQARQEEARQSCRALHEIP